MDHDQRFKELIREFVLELLAIFLPVLARQLVGCKVRWLPTEVFTNPPTGQVSTVDMLGMVENAQGTELRVLHLEAESASSLTEVRRKIGLYLPTLLRRFSMPITTLALYQNVGLGGLGWDSYSHLDPDDAEEVVLQTRWRYVGSTGLDAEEYLVGKDLVALALCPFMRYAPERKLAIRAEILRRLATECQENDYRKHLLISTVEVYMPLDGDEEVAFANLLLADTKFQEVSTMLLSTFDKGEKAGFDKGLKAAHEALVKVIVQLGSKTLGEPTEEVLTALRGIEELARLENLATLVNQASSWESLLNAGC